MTPKAIYKTIKQLDLGVTDIADACGLTYLELNTMAAQHPRIRKAIQVHLRMAENATIERLKS